MCAQERNRLNQPWTEDGKIPWNDPSFSARMLAQHLSQDHDLASRRATRIDAHVQWVHEHVLHEEPSRVLDLGCGPGLYMERFARLGHRCVGIDFSPASIDYAVEMAARKDLDCRYLQLDLRAGHYGRGFDLAILVYGELNAFKPEDAAKILAHIHAALKPGGRILLEVNSYASVKATGTRESVSYRSEGGLFSDQSHDVFRESSWLAEHQVAVDQYVVLEHHLRKTTHYYNTLQAYTALDLARMVERAGFVTPTRLSSWPRSDGDTQDDFYVLLSERQG